MVRAGIQAEGLAQCQAMFDFLAENAGRVEAGEAEREILNRLREIGRLGVEEFFAAKGAGDVGPWLEGEGGTLYERETRDHTRTYISLFGKVKVRRVGYRHRGSPAVFPLDAEANLPLLAGPWTLVLSTARGRKPPGRRGAVRSASQSPAPKATTKDTNRARRTRRRHERHEEEHEVGTGSDPVPG